MDITEMKRVSPQKIGMSITELCFAFGLCKTTVISRIDELEQEVKKGRYGKHSVMRDVGITLVNPFVFCDYLTYRKQLRDSKQRNSVPVYDPEAIAKELSLHLVQYY